MNQATAAFLSALVTLLVGGGGLYLSGRRDRNMERSAVVVGRSDEVNAVVAAWTNLAASLQADAQALRDEAIRDDARWAAAEERARVRAAECEECWKKLRRLQRRYNDYNGNGDTLLPESK